jgi:ATP-dependent DNA helicase RecG
VQAKGQLLTQLFQLTAKVPFDDRRRTDVPLSAISERLIRQFLEDIQSDLASPGTDIGDVLRQLRLSAKNNGGEVPRNIALLVFTERPDQYIESARIEIAHFRDDAGGDVIETKSIVGPLQHQVRQTLDYLSNLGSQVIQKVEGQLQAERFVAFPYLAMREAIVNAVYHRGYDSPPAPIKIGLYPDRLEITSYPGPVPGLNLEHLAPGGHPPQLPARNPRVGELLKSLRLAETWHTGIPKIRRSMKENGSPSPTFDFDADRTYFRVTLPAHPGYIVLHALREAAALWHTGEKVRALAHLGEARIRVPTSGALAAQFIMYAAANDDMVLARRTLSDLEQMPLATERHLAYTALARAYVDRNQLDEARALLSNVPAPLGAPEAVELAILYKRSADWEQAHQIFSAVQHAIGNDPKALHEFAQTKLRLAEQMQPRSPQDKVIKRRLNLEAAELLRRVIALASDQATRAAWAWFDLAKTLAWLNEPESEVRRAYEKAIELDPEEERFRQWFNRRSSRPTKPRRH